MLFLCRFFALEVPNRWPSHVHTGQERTKMIWPKKSLTNLTRRNVFFLQLKFSMNQCANALQWILLKEDWFFSSKRLHGFRQVVQYALWHCKIINFQINTRGRLPWLRTARENWWGTCTSRKSRHLTNNTNKSKQTTKTRTNQNNPNKNQTNKKQHPQEWLATKQTTATIETVRNRRSLKIKMKLTVCFRLSGVRSSSSPWFLPTGLLYYIVVSLIAFAGQIPSSARHKVSVEIEQLSWFFVWIYAKKFQMKVFIPSTCSVVNMMHCSGSCSCSCNWSCSAMQCNQCSVVWL